MQDTFEQQRAGLLSEFGELWDRADKLWEARQSEDAFSGYVSADYVAVFQSLEKLRGSVHSVLEWGSGLGVVTIMASRMGFDAYGIEAEGELVEFAEAFAEDYGPQAKFAEGSFIPDGFNWNPAEDADVFGTMIDVSSGYDQFDLELRDFDLIYAYPWPDEHTLYHNIIREYGRRDSLLLTYDAREGIALTEFRKR